MYFHVKGYYKNSCKIYKWHPLWEEEGSNYAIQFGTWLEVELYIKEGDENYEEFYMAVTPEGGKKVIVFDIIQTTQHPDETCPDGYTHMQPLKLYTSDKIINYMNQGKKELSVYWDDWSFSINN